MGFSVTILLTTGENSGPTYNVYECVNDTCNLFITDLPITSGQPFNITGITEGTLSLKIESIGDCNNSVIIPIQNLPTPTPTPTPTSTSIPTPTPTNTVTPTSTSIPILTSTPTPTNTVTPTPTNTVTPTPTSDPLVFSTFYLSGGVFDNDGHCGQDYLTGTPVYVEGTITTVPPLLNKTLYSDTSLTNEFNGGNLYYFVDTNNGASTTDLLANLGQYPVISITSSGYVGTVETINCNNEGTPL
jgi:hypothetical protein